MQLNYLLFFFVHYILINSLIIWLQVQKELKCHEVINSKYGEGTCELVIRDQYRNMVEKIRPDNYHLIENAVAACEAAGVKPLIQPIRGGTDGATLSFMGLPCPNLGTGGYACHGPYEHVCVEEMDQCVAVALHLVKTYAKA